MKTYYYTNEKSILASEESCNLIHSPFQKDGKLWEEKSIMTFFNLVDNNQRVNIIDIGAQIGLYSLFAKYLPNSTFYSFEPFPLTYRLLLDNIKLNNVSNIKTYNMAISDKKGKAILNTSRSHNGLHSMGNNILRFSDIEPLEIDTDTLDNMFYDKNIHVNYIKIDTEGYEYFILKAGYKTIQKYKPIIQLEWNTTNMKQCNVEESELRKLISELNYEIVEYGGEEVIIFPKK